MHDQKQLIEYRLGTSYAKLLFSSKAH